jgi:hypothetical protein
MSYDLFFRLRSPGSRFSLPNFVDYFKARPRYEIKSSQAWYSNVDSGVYFGFTYTERNPDSATDDDIDSSLLPVAFNMNYFRPHPFGLEAEPELAAFVREFDLTVSDPQTSGMGDGEYSTDGFLRGWNAGNAFAYSAICSRKPGQKYLTLPSSRIEAAWRWNLFVARRQNEIGNTVFVPRIFFFVQGGELRTGIVWADGIPILLPAVDIILVPRQELAPMRGSRTQDDIVTLEWDQLESIARRYRKVSEELDRYELFYGTTPPDIEQIVREKQPPTELPKGVAFDQILDREVVEQVRKNQARSS